VSSPTAKSVRRLDAISDREALRRVNNLAPVVEFEESVVGIVVAHLDVAALFEAVSNDAPVLAVFNP
jgi:hypothetical protein